MGCRGMALTLPPCCARAPQAGGRGTHHRDCRLRHGPQPWQPWHRLRLRRRATGLSLRVTWGRSRNGASRSWCCVPVTDRRRARSRGPALPPTYPLAPRLVIMATKLSARAWVGRGQYQVAACSAPQVQAALSHQATGIVAQPQRQQRRRGLAETRGSARIDSVSRAVLCLRRRRDGRHPPRATPMWHTCAFDQRAVNPCLCPSRRCRRVVPCGHVLWRAKLAPAEVTPAGAWV